MRGDDPTFDYVLAEKLRQSVGWVRALPNEEYVGWQQYLTVKGVLADLAARTEAHRGQH